MRASSFLVFDGDADRCFIIDERRGVVEPFGGDGDDRHG